MNKDLKEAARLLGSIKSEKKAVAVRRNLEKARAMKAEIDRVKKGRAQ